MFWNIASFCSLSKVLFTNHEHEAFISLMFCFYSYLSSFHSSQIVCFIVIKYSGYYERWALKKDCHWTDKLVISQCAWKQGRIRVGKVSFRDNVFWRQLQQCWNPLPNSISSFFFFFQFNCKYKIWQVKRCIPRIYLTTELLNWWTVINFPKVIVSGLPLLFRSDNSMQLFLLEKSTIIPGVSIDFFP